MYPRLELTGQVFGCYTVLNYEEQRSYNSYWRCRCRCGEIKIVGGSKLVSGSTKSCGCLRRQRMIQQHFVHGETGSPEWVVWQSMRTRCSNPNQQSAKYYIGAGVSVCDRWQNSFENFLSDMGRKPSSKYSLDRIDSTGNYEPSNCRWATGSQQAQNRRNMADLTGRVFHDLTVVAYSGSEDGKRLWLCQCVCGLMTKVRTAYLNNGHTKSCGCRRGYWARFK